MRLSHAAAVILLVPALALARDEPKKEKVEEPDGFLEVPGIFAYHINKRLVSFNGGRPYAISINEHLPDAKACRTKLLDLLKEQKQLDKFVFNWFGKTAPKQMNIMIGDKVPVQTAQAVIKTYAVGRKMLVYVQLMTKDDDFDHTAQVYVGGLVEPQGPPATAEQLRELVKPGLSQERFAEMLTKDGK